MPDNTPVYDLLFDMEMGIVNAFPSFTPLSLRREKAREVYTLIVRYNKYSRKKKKNKGKQIIRRPAPDTWF